MQLSSLGQPNHFSFTYYKMSLIKQFEYGTRTAVSIELKKDWVKPLKAKPMLQNSIILKPQEDIKQLENIYTFENSKDIRRFLLTHQHLIGILFEAVMQIKRIFGEEISRCLELHHDPEEDWEELFVVIKTTYPPEKARKLMDKLGDEWFLDIMDETEGKLCITEEPL